MGSETVTVMFTDLVESTALLSRVGPVVAEELRREHFAILRTAVERSGGREVKNLGDGVMVVFPNAADAVAAATAAQQGLARRNARAEHELLVRIGLALGDADAEDGDYFGVPVVEAARLCAQAAGGEILATDLVRILASSRAQVDFEPVGALELKGLDRPVAACRVAWEPVADADGAAELRPLPPRLASSISSAFVGRVAERDALQSAWKAASTERDRRIVLLAGEPGIGKTTLSAEFAARVQGDGGAVVYGRCDEDLGIPYQPWVEALAQLVEAAPDAALAEHVAERGAVLARVVPGLARRVPTGAAGSGGDGDAERFVLFAAVADLLERVSQVRPVLVVLDDLHWADRQTVQLLRHVAMADRPMALVVLGTFRDSEVGAAHPLAELLAALHRERGVDRIGLRGLTDADLLELLEQVAGHEMSDDGIAVRDAVLAETAGNPFFVGEILRHLAETGAIYQRDDGQWAAKVDIREAGLPISVKEVVGRRLAGLGHDTERVLALAAVIGRDFDVPLLAAVAELSEDDVVDLCDAAVFAAVLRTTDDPDRYTFAHALIEHTLYDGLSPARRARAHRAVAEHLEAACGAEPGERAGELAHHWGAAVKPTDVEKALHYALLAAARAVDQLAPDEAVRWFTDALDLLGRSASDDRRRRAEILIGLGEAQRQVGVAAHREHLLEAARLADSVDAVDLLVTAALANFRGFQSVIGGVDRERVAVINRALERLGPDEHADRARLLAQAALEQIYDTDIDERMSLAEAAIDAARQSGDPAALVFALSLGAGAISAPWTLEKRAAWTAEGCDIAEGLGDTLVRFYVNQGRIGDALEQGDIAAYRRHRARAIDVTERIPHAALRWNVAFNSVVLAVLEGDLAEAERRADAALAMAVETGQAEPMAIYAPQLVNIRFHQGRKSELLSLIEQVVADSPGLPVYRAVLACAHAQHGERRRAALLLEEDRKGGFAMPADQAWLTAFAEWTSAALDLGDLESAAVLHQRLVPFHYQVITTGITVLPVVAHYLGGIDHLLGRHDDADRWFDEAMTIHRGLDSPLLTAYTEVAWADLLADRARPGDHQRARELAATALTTATSGDYRDIAADAQRVLEALDASP